MTTPSLEQRILVAPDTLVDQLGDESVLLKLSTGEYFGLDRTATTIWNALTTGHTIQQAIEYLLDEYDVEVGLLTKDVLDLVARLIANELIQISS